MNYEVLRNPSVPLGKGKNAPKGAIIKTGDVSESQIVNWLINNHIKAVAGKDNKSMKVNKTKGGKK